MLELEKPDKLSTSFNYPHRQRLPYKYLRLSPIFLEWILLRLFSEFSEWIFPGILYKFPHKHLRPSPILSEWILLWDCFSEFFCLSQKMSRVNIVIRLLLNIVIRLLLSIVIRLHFMIWVLWLGSSEFKLKHFLTMSNIWNS